MKVFLVAGARPNFMKIAPIYRASRKVAGVNCQIVHTGQHYDYEMSQAFFEDLEIPKPTYFLDAGSGSHAVQTAKIMVRLKRSAKRNALTWSWWLAMSIPPWPAVLLPRSF